MTRPRRGPRTALPEYQVEASRRGSRTPKATWSALFQPEENQPRQRTTEASRSPAPGLELVDLRGASHQGAVDPEPRRVGVTGCLAATSPRSRAVACWAARVPVRGHPRALAGPRGHCPGPPGGFLPVL